MFILKNRETSQVRILTAQELCDELNRDRGNDWSDYTLDNSLKEIEEAIEHFTEYVPIGSKM